MKIALIALAFLSYGIWQKYKKPTLNMNSLTSIQSCTGKKLCALVYIAPWCPACEQMSPILKTFLTNSKTVTDYGFQIIVGDERSPGHNDQKAASLGPGTLVDADRSIAKAMKVTYYPTFYILDPKGKVVMKDQDAVTWANEHFSGR